MNVLLITADSLRADTVGVYGGKARTPNIDSLASEGRLFRYAFSTGPHTTQSFPGILASNYPTTGGSVMALGCRLALASVMKEAGFRTGAFHSNPQLSAARGYSTGFDEFWDSGESVSAERWPVIHRLSRRIGARIAGRNRAAYRILQRVYHRFSQRTAETSLAYTLGEQIGAQAKDWIAGLDGERFFLWLHYMDTHWPYATAPRFGRDTSGMDAAGLARKALRTPARLARSEVDELRRLYVLEVEYFDECLGDLFGFLRARRLWDDTVVAVTSDHGDEFLEHGVCFHPNLLYDTLIRVPLLVKPASGARGRVVEDVVSLIDVAPTLCQLARVPVPDAFEGKSLLQRAGGGVVFAEVAHRSFVSERPELACVRDAEWKYIRDLGAESEELYYLPDDPAETGNCAAAQPAVAQRFRRTLLAHVDRVRPATANVPPRDGVQPQVDDEQVIARLRDLGYVD